MVGEKVLIGAVLALGAALAFQSWRLLDEQQDHVQTQLQWSKERETHTAAALNAQTEYNAKAAAERARAQQANEDAKKRIDILAADVARAGTERERLRLAYSAAVARSCQAGTAPTPTGASQATSAPANLPADVLGRIDAAADGVAEFAERAMSAAEACASAW